MHKSTFVPAQRTHVRTLGGNRWGGGARSTSFDSLPLGKGQQARRSRAWRRSLRTTTTAVRGSYYTCPEPRKDKTLGPDSPQAQVDSPREATTQIPANADNLGVQRIVVHHGLRGRRTQAGASPLRNGHRRKQTRLSHLRSGEAQEATPRLAQIRTRLPQGGNRAWKPLARKFHPSSPAPAPTTDTEETLNG